MFRWLSENTAIAQGAIALTESLVIPMAMPTMLSWREELRHKKRFVLTEKLRASSHNPMLAG